MQQKIFDAAVIGGGASGMVAAISAARSGASVALLEAQPRVGRKLLATGNGRCNITNAAISPEHYRSDAAERAMRIMRSVDIRGFFSSIGVEMLEEREGRMYPRSETASGVLDMLRAELARLGVETICEFRVKSILYGKGIWTVGGTTGSIRAGSVVIACGSPAAPSLGGCGDTGGIAESLNIEYIPQKPVLSCLPCGSPILPSLKGVRVHCAISLVIDGRTLHTETGELQFNDNNLSGICVFQMSSRIAEAQVTGTSDIRINADLLPEYTSARLAQLLLDRRKLLGHLPLEDFLSGLLNKRLAAAVFKLSGISPLSRRADTLSGRDIGILAGNIKRLSFPVSPADSWKQAQTAQGGIPLLSLNDDLQINGQRSLFACGEAANCDGDCGGFNLHWAWCSGITAGRAAAKAALK